MGTLKKMILLNTMSASRRWKKYPIL